MVTISNVVALVGQPLSDAEIVTFEILLLDCSRKTKSCTCWRNKTICVMALKVIKNIGID